MRTEFCFMHRTTRPSVEEQHQVYQEIADSFTTGEVIFRTFDVAADKKLDFIDTHLSDATEEQLHALCKVSGNVSVMAPLIANAPEAEVFASLARENGFKKIGVMLEKVSLLDQVDALHGVLDFISIGTNDLAQDLFQQDRLNPANPELLDFLIFVSSPKINSLSSFGRKKPRPIYGVVKYGFSNNCCLHRGYLRLKPHRKLDPSSTTQACSVP